MNLRRTTQRSIALLAVVVTSFSALTPAPANAFAINNMGPAMWIELCSLQGKKRIAVYGAGIPVAGISASVDDSQSVSHTAVHCPFCHIEHAPAALPAASAGAVLGTATRRILSLSDALIGQVSVSEAINSRRDFKPSMRVELSAGWAQAFTQNVGAVMQLNRRHRAREPGTQAEPANSGSTRAEISPGTVLGVGQASTLYAYLQVPIYQRVNGHSTGVAQLTSGRVDERFLAVGRA